MFHSLRQGYTRVVLGAILVAAFGLTAYQYPSGDHSAQVVMDVCDHTDAKKECEEIVKGDLDEFVRMDQKSTFMTPLQLADESYWTQKDYLIDPPENPTPPPELS